MALKLKVLRKRNINDEEIETTTQFYKENGTIDRDELDKLLNQISTKGNNKYDTFGIKLIRILNGDKWATFNDFDDLDDYYQGKVHNVDKFFE